MAAEYSVEFKAAAQRAWNKLPSQVQAQLAPVIDALATNPRPPSVVKLKGTDSLYRVRSGNFRIVYQVNDDVLVVLIVKVGHRRDVYRGMEFASFKKYFYFSLALFVPRRIKEIGQAARKEIETLVEGKVFLELRVKVRDKWREDESWIRRFEYNDGKVRGMDLAVIPTKNKKR